MNKNRTSISHRLIALLALLAFVFNLVPLHAGLSQSRGSLIFTGNGALWRLRGETLDGGLPLGGGATLPSGLATYTLDAVGNRTARTSTIAGLASQTFGYNENDRITGDTYDANGNTKVAQVSQPVGSPAAITGTDSYDANDRLISRSGAAGSEVVAYDGDGQRVSESVTRNGLTTVTTLLVDELSPTGYAQVVEEKTNGVLNKVWHYGHALISQDAWVGGAWTLAYYGYDGHGSVRFLTDAQGNVTDTYEYDAFGTLLATTGATPNRHRYCGEVFDDSLGLYYLRARLMNPLTGRFWTADGYEGSQSDPASLHKYLYCHHSPINCVDPSGFVPTSGIISGSRYYGGFLRLAARVGPAAAYAIFFGIAAHEAIYRDYEDTYGDESRGVFTNKSIASVAALNELAIDDLAQRPDMVNKQTGEVWEIKSGLGVTKVPHLVAQAQAERYIGILNDKDKDKAMSYRLGTSYNPGAVDLWPFWIGTVIIDSWNPGALVYYPDSANIAVFALLSVNAQQGLSSLINRFLPRIFPQTVPVPAFAR